jgi:hypothetical protein
MVRISNGFQLKLEDENVFYAYYNVTPPGGSRTASVPIPQRDVGVSPLTLPGRE